MGALDLTKYESEKSSCYVMVKGNFNHLIQNFRPLWPNIRYERSESFQLTFQSISIISGMGVMGRVTRPLPLPDPLELPAPYPILPLPD